MPSPVVCEVRWARVLASPDASAIGFEHSYATGEVGENTLVNPPLDGGSGTGGAASLCTIAISSARERINTEATGSELGASFFRALLSCSTVAIVRSSEATEEKRQSRVVP